MKRKVLTRLTTYLAILFLGMSSMMKVGVSNTEFYDMSHYPPGAKDYLYEEYLDNLKNGKQDNKVLGSLCYSGAISPEYTKKFVDAGYLKEYVDEFVDAGILPDSYAPNSGSNSSGSSDKNNVSETEAFRLSMNKLSLKVGEKEKLSLVSCNTGKAISADKIKWRSKNKLVVKVTKKGVVKAKTVGEATVVAKYNNQKYKCKVVVGE